MMVLAAMKVKVKTPSTSLHSHGVRYELRKIFASNPKEKWTSDLNRSNGVESFVLNQCPSAMPLCPFVQKLEPHVFPLVIKLQIKTT